MAYEKVFIVAPHFPPSALPPSQRVRLLVKYLADFDYWPKIFTVNHYYRDEISDEWMVAIAGDKFELIEVGCLNQRMTKKFGVGDLGLRMFFPLFFSIIKEIKQERPKIILFPVPPWYIMVLGPFIKWVTGIPYAIDFIDPWVHESVQKGIKAKLSQWIARMFEGFVVRRSNVIFAVSEGILSDIKKRYPSIRKKAMIAVPYGVEIADYRAINIEERKNTDSFSIRYTGAVSDAMLPVVDTMLKALKIVHKEVPLNVVFTGTSYAGGGNAEPRISQLIYSNEVSDFISEIPDRVGYRKALEISLGSDMQLLLGDTTPYYAASKLMGLIASQRLFFAFVYEKSFPSNFLDEIGYLDKVSFTIDNLASKNKIEELANGIKQALKNSNQFRSVDINNNIFNKHTAKAMTKVFADNF